MGLDLPPVITCRQYQFLNITIAGLLNEGGLRGEFAGGGRMVLYFLLGAYLRGVSLAFRPASLASWRPTSARGLLQPRSIPALPSIQDREDDLASRLSLSVLLGLS